MTTRTKKAKTTVETITTDFRPERSYSAAIPCPRCGAYCERKDWKFTLAEVRSDFNCGRPWACCLAGFWCPKCKVRILAHQQAPEMG